MLSCLLEFLELSLAHLRLKVVLNGEVHLKLCIINAVHEHEWLLELNNEIIWVLRTLGKLLRVRKVYLNVQSILRDPGRPVIFNTDLDIVIFVEIRLHADINHILNINLLDANVFLCSHSSRIIRL